MVFIMAYPNNFSNDSWRVNFSNIPKMENDEKIDMLLIDTYVKSVTLPDLSVETINSDFMGDTYRHPNSRTNDDLGQVAIEFGLSEDMKNYNYFYQWFQMLRHGITDATKFNDCVIKDMTVQMLDNQKRVTNKMSFTNCLLSSVGSLNLGMGQSELVTFPLLLQYQEMKRITI